MKYLVFVSLVGMLVGPALCTSGCSSLPRRHPGQVTLTDPESCPSTVDSLAPQVSAELDTLIDSLLPQLQASLSPSPCQGLGWTKIADINMANPSHSCPQGWVNGTFPDSSRQLCRRPSDQSECASAFFSTEGVEYSQVCGMIKAYQYGSPEAFQDFNFMTSLTLNDQYVDGVVISRGANPEREHVWTFAAGLDETQNSNEVCPCISTMAEAPPFIGSNYFCESGVLSHSSARTLLYEDAPLWDGCNEANACCSRHNPPYFSATLSSRSCEDLEVRLCAGAAIQEEVPVERIELYVK